MKQSRLLRLCLWELRFTTAYGIVLLYAVLTVFYLILLSLLPAAWKQTAAVLLIYSDPATMGLFFMGAIVLLEKSQRVPFALAVSPVRILETVFAKVASLGLLSLLVALPLSFAAQARPLWRILLGTLLGSILYTLLGLIAAYRIQSLNQFILLTIPIELLCLGPAVYALFFEVAPLLALYPPIFCLRLIAGASALTVPAVIVYLLALCGLLYLACQSIHQNRRCL